jgi:SAM-dependent methyltransferase
MRSDCRPREHPLLIEAPRLERAHVEFPEGSWTSFDRYSRYGSIVRTIRANLGPGNHRVLDVGDTAGYLLAFDAGLDAVGLDPVVTPVPLPGTVRLAGDGTRLPFPDRSFAAVVSSDVLEHVAPARRPEFLSELSRVAQEVVIVAAPFDTPGVAGAEELVRRFVLLASGDHQAQLEEHRDNGLPGLEESIALLVGQSLHVATSGNGNLHDWIAMMMLKHQITSRPALDPLDAGYDIFYNLLYASRENVEPFYRQLIVARRSRAPVLTAPPVDILGVSDDPTPLLTLCTAANVAEVSRQDTVPRLDAIQRELSLVSTTIEHRIDTLEQRFVSLGDQIEGLNRRIAKVTGLLRHPLETVRHRVRPAPDDR